MLESDFVQDVYIDESYDSKVFVISFCTSSPYAWRYLRILWQACLDGTNHRLAIEGRPLISRYHATDIANCKKDFAGWNQAEQIAMTEDLISAILCCPMHCFSVCVVLEELQSVMGEVFRAKMDTRSLHLAAYYLSVQIASDLLLQYVHGLNNLWKFKFIYDRGPYEH
jgi:hypothetical protein